MRDPLALALTAKPSRVQRANAKSLSAAYRDASSEVLVKSGWSNAAVRLAALVIHPWEDHPPPGRAFEAEVYKLKGEGLRALSWAQSDSDRSLHAASTLSKYFAAAERRGETFYMNRFSQWRDSGSRVGEASAAPEADASVVAPTRTAQPTDATSTLALAAAADLHNDEQATMALSRAARSFGLNPDDFPTWIELVAAFPRDGRDHDAIDLSTLVVAADLQNDKRAMIALRGLAEWFGLDPDAYGTWVELVVAFPRQR